MPDGAALGVVALGFTDPGSAIAGTSDPALVGDLPAATALDTWAAVLDSLEASIDEATAGELAATALIRQTAVLGSWTPPVAIGPIPESLVPRARRINERQRAALTTLTTELNALRRHRSVLGSVQSATAPQQASVYLDVTG